MGYGILQLIAQTSRAVQKRNKAACGLLEFMVSERGKFTLNSNKNNFYHFRSPSHTHTLMNKFA